MAIEEHEFHRWVEQSGTRFPAGFVEDRLDFENRKAASIFESESRFIGKWFNPRELLTLSLRLSGLSRRGIKNALDIVLRNNTIAVPELPVELEGYKILQISDPHFNDHAGFLDKIERVVDTIDFDLCVFTGDYRFRSFGTSDQAIKGLSELARFIDTKMLAVLGNHDSIKMVPQIENIGITVLVNEHMVIERGSTKLLIAGVDDPRFYRTDDIELSLTGAPDNTLITSILLAHSPELYVDAANSGFDAYLCGHTHGGQVCLVRGKTLFKNFRSPGWTLAGCWEHDGMQGYTSAGVGTSVVNARFNCEPEITLHELSGRKQSA